MRQRRLRRRRAPRKDDEALSDEGVLAQGERERRLDARGKQGEAIVSSRAEEA
jgi:hypothetical protein